jgi:hypothetical protein
MRWLSLVLLTTCLVPGTDAAAAQGLSEARQLFAELQVESTSDRAADQLRVIAQRDPDARHFLAEQLPTLMEKIRGTVWLNAVRLTGDLKIPSPKVAQPTLVWRFVSATIRQEEPLRISANQLLRLLGHCWRTRTDSRDRVPPWYSVT